MSNEDDVSSDPAHQPVSPRVAAALDAWKRKLLDLSKRNRALNFKPTRVSTVTIVDERAGEVFRRLRASEGKMTFAPARANAEAPVSATPTEENGEPEFDAGVDFAPYDAAALAERHTDSVLQTSLSEEQLDHALLRIAQLASSSIEEQGVNTLFLALGMLEYREARDGQEVFRAPLVLLPVELRRQSARAAYAVRATDEDPLVNPALVEYLRVVAGIAIPPFPADGIPEEFELSSLFAAVVDAVAGRGWSVKDEIHLGLFSFQKFAMFKDLETHGRAFGAHRVVEQIVERKVDALVGLPADVEALELDRDFAPESTAQVVDADSSQLRAIAAVARGHDLVLIGPPGTGKSQTITNLIAQALSQGKSVLFVAEKLAALQVVHSRLERAGLAPFCLEVHSTKANKREVIQSIKAALDASLQRPAVPSDARRALPRLREDLAGYVNAAHRPFGALRMSPFQACGEFGKVLAAPRTEVQLAVVDVDREAFDGASRALRELAAALREVGDPRAHPWRDADKDYYSQADLAAIRTVAREVIARLDDIATQTKSVAADLGLPGVATWDDADELQRVSDVVARSPGVARDVLTSANWDSPPADALALIDRVALCAELRARSSAWFVDDVFATEHAADIAFVERKTAGIFGFLAFLDGRYRALRRRWLALRRPGYSKPMLDQAADLKVVDRYTAERAVLRACESDARKLFGETWRGEASDVGELRAYVAWVVEFRALLRAGRVQAPAIELATSKAPDVSRARELVERVRATRAQWQELRRLVGWSQPEVSSTPLASIRDRLDELANGIALGPQWAGFVAARTRARSSAAEPFVQLATDGSLALDELETAFVRRFFEVFTDAAISERVELRQFRATTHEQRRDEFRRLDEQVLEENRVALVARLRDRVQERLRSDEAAPGKTFLLREMNRTRGLSPLRKTMQQAEATIRAIKPCFLMSPLTVAQLLRGEAPTFDLVIFDEASQMPAEDAIGSMARGRQLVVVGDPKQLPPTDFFRVIAGVGNTELDEAGNPVVQDTESVLEEFASAGAPRASLKWHYRSRCEALIEFSNASFYDGELYTFPSVASSAREGVEFVHVADGVYEGAGLNLAEVRAVVDAIARHARDDRGSSLGVGTFNLRQQIAIQDELERRRREDPELEPFLAARDKEPFFVKNLENIQGDERDVIFISVTYGRSRDGKLRHNFGPLNGQNGWRRLNVIATRARKRMKVFASIRGDDISVAAAGTDGPRLLKEFLTYVEHGRLDGARVTHQASAESAFERDVLRELTARGVTLQPQVGVSGYRIDFGVVDPSVPGRFVCGLECDGVAYHAAQSARDRDRLRQQVLEGRGWEIHRIWSTDWFKDREAQIERLLRLIDESRERATQARTASEPVVVRETPEAANAAEIADSGAEYVRPTFAPYRFANLSPQAADILEVPLARIAALLGKVIEVEGPIHVGDLFARVITAFGKARVGANIGARLEQALQSLIAAGRAVRQEDFVWNAGHSCVARDRNGMRTAAEKIAPEEFRVALASVLKSAVTLSKEALFEETRGALGVGRSRIATQRLEQALAQMLSTGEAGESSAGIGLRT